MGDECGVIAYDVSNDAQMRGECPHVKRPGCCEKSSKKVKSCCARAANDCCTCMDKGCTKLCDTACCKWCGKWCERGCDAMLRGEWYCCPCRFVMFILCLGC